MRKIYNLRRIAVLLIVFGLGLIVGGNFNPIIQNIYIGFGHYFMIWHLKIERLRNDKKRQIRTNKKTC